MKLATAPVNWNSPDVPEYRAYTPYRDTYPPSLEFLLGSGGLFLDMSVHDFDLARFLVGEVDEVCAWGGVLIDERFAQANDADTAFTLLKFKNGVLGAVETSRHSNWGYDIRTEVAGSVGKVVVEAPQKRLCSLLRISPQATIITRISPTVLRRVTDCSWRLSLRRCGKVASQPPAGRRVRNAPPGRRCHQELARKTPGQAFGDWNLTSRRP